MRRLDKNLKTVQAWRNGVMVTAMMPRERAEELVKEGKAYVVSGQAIEFK